LIRTYIRPKNLKFFFGQINNTYILGTIIYSISIFALYLTIAVIYKLTISKFTEYISKKMSDLFDKIMLKFKKPKDEIKQA